MRHLIALKGYFKLPLYLILVTSFFCSANVYSQNQIDVINLSDISHPFYSVNSLSSFTPSKSISLDDIVIGSSYDFTNRGDQYFIISKDDFKVLRYNKHFNNLMNTYGRAGRGPGEGNFIQSYEITSDKIILYDSGLRKIICFDYDGNLIFEKHVQDQTFPYNITDLIHVYSDVYLAAGISMEEWNNFNQGQSYKNVYLLRINSTNLEVLDSISIIPPNIMNGIESRDVIASTVSYPFKFSKHAEHIYLYNFASGRVFEIEVRDNKIIPNNAIDLTNNFFSEHPEITQNEFNRDSSKREEWIKSGNFMINVFKNSDSIIFYTSNIIEIGFAEYQLIFINPETYKVQYKYILKDENIIRNIGDNEIQFFSFDYDLEEYVFTSISLDEFLNNDTY